MERLKRNLKKKFEQTLLDFKTSLTQGDAITGSSPGALLAKGAGGAIVAKAALAAADVQMVTAMVNGEQWAVEKFALKISTDKNVVGALVATALNDYTALEREIKCLAQKVGLDGGMAVAVRAIIACCYPLTN